MAQADTANADSYTHRSVPVLDSEMSYVEAGDTGGRPIIFLHGNPTSSYLWRNIMPFLEPLGRCLAPDLIGMGRSGKASDGSYRFADHVRYVDAWLEAMALSAPAVFVIHDWGSALGFHWSHRHPDKVAGIAYMEAIVKPIGWADWPAEAREIFQAFRSPAGEELILEKNMFIEGVLPRSIIRELSDAEMDAYRAPFREPGDSRRPTLTWPRQLPIDGEPEDVCKIVADYGAWLKHADLPKLFINADPGAILVGQQRDFCRSWANQSEITVAGRHFLQEDSPAEIGLAVAEFVTALDG